MPYYHLVQGVVSIRPVSIRPNPVRPVPVRQVLPNPQVFPRAAVQQQQRPPVVVQNHIPRQLPVLQPPIYPRESDFYEQEEQQYEDIYYPTVVFPDQHRRITQPFSNRTAISTPTYLQQQSTRHAKQQYPSYIYYKR